MTTIPVGTPITVMKGHRKGQHGKVVEVTVVGLIYITLDKYKGTDYDGHKLWLYAPEELRRRV